MALTGVKPRPSRLERPAPSRLRSTLMGVSSTDVDFTGRFHACSYTELHMFIHPIRKVSGCTGKGCRIRLFFIRAFTQFDLGMVLKSGGAGAEGSDGQITSGTRPAEFDVFEWLN
jgi:hypothetical protein